MKSDKIFALAAYVFQALASLLLVFGVSRLLPTQEFGHYSLVVATAQSASVLTFEWIRLAAARFCADVDHADSERRRQTVLMAFFSAMLVLGLVGGLFVLMGGAQWQEAAAGLAIAVMIGATDLQLVFLRVQGSFTRFSRLQTSRAALLLTLSCLLAWKTQNTIGALAGLVAGYVVSLVLFVAAAPGWWRPRLALARWGIFQEMAKYGAMAAAASVTALQVPLLLRWTARSFMGADAFGGFSLAMDILQKPFALVTTAIGGVLTPAVVVDFERQTDPRHLKLKRLYEAQIWAVMLLLGGAMGMLPDVAEILVKPALREGLLATGAWVGIVFAMHTLIQSTMAIPGHLLKAGPTLIQNAAIELALVGLSVVPCVYGGWYRPFDWGLWVLVAVFLSGLVALPLVRRVPCPPPKTTLYLAPALALLLGLGAQWTAGTQWPWLAVKSLSMLVVCAVGWFVYRKLAARWG